MYDQLPEEDRHKQSYTEWVKEAYHDQYEKWYVLKLLFYIYKKTPAVV